MMHPGEIPIDESLVVKLLHARFPSWANLPLRKVESTGTEYALFRLGDDMVVRLPRVEQFSKNIQKEHTWLPKLAPHLPVPVPKPLAKGQPSGYFPFEWSIYSWIEGEAVSFNYRSDPEALAMDLADFNKALRNIDPADGPPSRRGAPLSVQDEPARRALDVLQGMIDTNAATTAWETDLGTDPWNGPQVWIHGDLPSMNLLVKNGRLCGVIDFSDLGIGDPACDMISAWYLFRPDVRKIFHDALDVDDDTWKRGRGWALSIALIQLPFIRIQIPYSPEPQSAQYRKSSPNTKMKKADSPVCL